MPKTDHEDGDKKWLRDERRDVAFSCELSPFRLGECAQGMSEACSKKYCGNDEDEPVCVPGSENNIHRVDMRDGGCVQPTAW